MYEGRMYEGRIKVIRGAGFAGPLHAPPGGQ
jgi:hypothetical protein